MKWLDRLVPLYPPREDSDSMKMCPTVVAARIARVIPDDWDGLNDDERFAFVIGAMFFAAGGDRDRMQAIIHATLDTLGRRGIVIGKG